MAASQEEWHLFYWPGIKGRGEFVRLMFEEAGVPYVDVGNGPQGMDAVIAYFYRGGQTSGLPACSPPAIQKGDFSLCNTPAIMSYLGKAFGMGPATKEGEAHVDQILAIVTDAISEGRLAYHPKDFYASHKTQVEESKPYIAQYVAKRVPKYMSYFESVLAHSGKGFFVGDSITAADIAVFHYLQAVRHHLREAFDSSDANLCKAFLERIAARPKIHAYQQSDRCPVWDADSLM
eukprot:evm.model.scf_373.2 EVM.evm.TU.scf_373.2   scf_373:16611-19768(+)